MSGDIDFIATNWWNLIETPLSGTNCWQMDYTRHRSGPLPYASPDELIGKKDYQKYILTTSDPTTVSGDAGSILI